MKNCELSAVYAEKRIFSDVSTPLFSRTCLAVKVDVETVHVTQRNGVGVTFSADVHELKLMLRNQVSHPFG